MLSSHRYQRDKIVKRDYRRPAVYAVDLRAIFGLSA